MVSVIIPSRSDQWLQKTVDDLFNKAEGDVEIVVVYDGRWADPILKDDPRLIQIHHGTLHDNYGMRASINLGVKASKGEFIMVIDEQCGVDQGYDIKLAADCEDNWVVIPRRKRLEPDNWTLVSDGRPDIDYMKVDYPYAKPFDKTQGLHGSEWRRPERSGLAIDDTPTMQGSCYFMKRSWWDKVIGPLDDVNYGPFTQEAQEVSFKTWFNDGRVVVNKNTWYAHWHKGSKGKGYGFSNAQYRRHMQGTEKGRVYCIQHWMSHPKFKWFIEEKFPDMPGWENWEERVKQDADKDFSMTYKESGYEPSW
jgi:glycosyltransferase involved in cell wall biosynthesis